MLKLDDHDSVDGHSKGALRSLDINQPTYVGGIPHPDEMKLGNRTHIAINLGLTKIAGNFLFFLFRLCLLSGQPPYKHFLPSCLIAICIVLSLSCIHLIQFVL
jgi:hypothetical protein